MDGEQCMSAGLSCFTAPVGMLGGTAKDSGKDKMTQITLMRAEIICYSCSLLQF